jgi:putative membrane-bound dehydrogenase-like protein
MTTRILVLCAAFATAISTHAQVALDKSEGTFKLSEGLELKLWGGEPLFVNPTCMDVDHKGRVWICESINYRQKLRGQKEMRRPEGDRILILEDAKGKGVLDTVTVFYQSPQIHSPLGIAVHPYTDGKGVKVFVCQSPDIWVFEDKDGDGKADSPPTVLLTGFKGLDHDHGVHGILIGPDHKLYFTVGDSGVSKLKSSDGKGKEYSSNTTDCRAATVWRCDLDGKNLQLIAHNFRNNYEPCVDSFGTVFLSDNDDDGNQQTRICYVMQGGDYGYHRSPKTSHWNEEHPGIVPKILRTYFGSPTGICMYEGKLLPAKYQGQMLHTDAGPRHLRAYILSPQGAAYAVEREDMVQSTDTWFRPSDVCVAPDGSLFVADWYDPGVGGHNMGDITRGRVYRVAPKGAPRQTAGKLDLTSNAGILAALGSPNLAVRAAAMSKIEEIGFDKAYPLLLQGLSQKDNRILRARVLWQLARFGNFKHIQQAFDDSDADFRVLALRIASDFFQTSPADLPESRQQKLLDDPSPAVRREALLLLQNVDPAKSGKLIHALADKYDGQDRFYLAAVGIAVGHHDAKRREALLADFEKHYPGWNAKVAGLVWELRPPHAASLLEKRLTDASLPAGQRAQIVDILATTVDAKGAEVLVKALTTEKDALVREHLLLKLKEHLPGKWKALQSTKELNDVVGSLLSDKKERIEGLRLIAQGELKNFLPKVLAVAQDEKAPIAERVASVQALGAFRTPEAQGVLSTIIANSSKQEPVAVEAVQALGRQSTPWSLEALRVLVTAKDAPKVLRQAAVVGLAGTKNGAESLLKDYEAKLIAADLNQDLSRLLRNSPFPDIKKRAQASLPAPPKFDPKNLPSIQALLTRKGNPERGKQVMQATLMNNAACLKCHVILGQGGKVGPELSVIGSKVSKENLLESILYPSRAIADQYITYVVETKDGRTIVGVIAEESPTQLILRDVNANEFKLDPKNVESKEKTNKSIMPEDLIQYLQEDDLLDLVEYLFSLKSPTISPAGVIADPMTPRKGKK